MPPACRIAGILPASAPAAERPQITLETAMGRTTGYTDDTDGPALAGDCDLTRTVNSGGKLRKIRSSKGPHLSGEKWRENHRPQILESVKCAQSAVHPIAGFRITPGALRSRPPGQAGRMRYGRRRRLRYGCFLRGCSGRGRLLQNAMKAGRCAPPGFLPLTQRPGVRPKSPNLP
jgi:hypothetical protein